MCLHVNRKGTHCDSEHPPAEDWRRGEVESEEEKEEGGEGRGEREGRRRREEKETTRKMTSHSHQLVTLQ